MDWEAWARKAERAIDVAAGGDWKGLFAPGATFSDPNTPSTDDMRQISRDTRAIFPDWTQEITSIRGGETNVYAKGRGSSAAAAIAGTPMAPAKATMRSSPGLMPSRWMSAPATSLSRMRWTTA